VDIGDTDDEAANIVLPKFLLSYTAGDGDNAAMTNACASRPTFHFRFRGTGISLEKGKRGVTGRYLRVLSTVLGHALKASFGTRAIRLGAIPVSVQRGAGL
jgi:hypothetical protein